MHGTPSANKHYQVCGNRLRNAISWLKTNNVLYSDTDLHISNNNIINIEDRALQNASHPDSLEQLDEASIVSVDSTLPDCSISDVIPQNNTIEVPSIKDKPVSVYSLERGEEMAFPWLFPEGQFGFNFKRPYSIPPSMYFKTCLYDRKGPFRKDITYLLHAAVSCEHHMHQSINIQMKMRKSTASANSASVPDGNTAATNSASVTAGYIAI